MLPQPLKNDSESVAGRNAARHKLIPQIAGGKLIPRAAVWALHGNSCHRLIRLERDLARHRNQVKGSSGCLRTDGGRQPGDYSECKKTHELTVHGPDRQKEECG